MQKKLFFLSFIFFSLSLIYAEDNDFDFATRSDYLAAHQNDTVVWWLDDFQPNPPDPIIWAKMAGVRKKIIQSLADYRSSLLITMSREATILTNKPPHFGYLFGDSIYFGEADDPANQAPFSIGFIPAKQNNNQAFVAYQTEKKRILILAQECPPRILPGLIFRELNYSLANNDRSAAVNFRLANIFAGNIIDQETSGDFFQYLDRLLAAKTSPDPLHNISAAELLRIDRIIGAKNIGPTLAHGLLDIYYGAMSSRLMALRMKRNN
jgi:hypothetical protein